jgi:hypothetical protein
MKRAHSESVYAEDSIVRHGLMVYSIDALQIKLERSLNPIIAPGFSMSFAGPLNYTGALNYIKKKLEIGPLSILEKADVPGDTDIASANLFMEILSLPNCTIKELRLYAGVTDLSMLKPNKFSQKISA